MSQTHHASARPIVLASQSPRRVELLREITPDFEVLPVDVEELHDPALTPQALTIENARRKALAAAAMRPDALVIGADTLVYIGGHPLGKPRDMSEAAEMLRRLSGTTHQVCTGIALASDGGVSCRDFAVISEVTFKTLTELAIEEYYLRVDPLDKAGAYAIQEHGRMIVEKISGSWSNIVGLPVERLRLEIAV